MKPGRELDKLVAEAMGLNVLGIAPCIINPECFGYDVAIDGRGDISQPVYIKQCMCYDKDPDDFIILGHTAFCLEVVPCYSTDIAAAWQAWEWLENNHPWECCQICLIRDDLTENRAVGKVFYEIQANIAVGETYPHAICLAVLEASKATK